MWNQKVAIDCVLYGDSILYISECIRTYALINTGIKQQKMIAILQALYSYIVGDRTKKSIAYASIYITSISYVRKLRT